MTRLAIIFSLLFVTPAWADNYFTYEKYKDLKEKAPEVSNFYLEGVGNGILFASGEGDEKIFCMPLDLDMTVPLLETAIEHVYDVTPEGAADMPISLLAVYGLKQIFPCKK